MNRQDSAGSPTVLLGISGGIAAYKTPQLVRLLVQSGMDVQCVLTRSATHFVTPLVLATLSGNPVYEDMWAVRDRPSVEHIAVADRADVAVIAPATANVIGKLAAGIADDLLTTVFTAVICPVLLCPAMNVNMYRNPIVQANLEKLRSVGFHVLDPDAGFLACGWEGEGRMPDPEVIAEGVSHLLAPRDLVGERILVTAGPTEEPLDPVRFITNRSSGKMGVAVADRAAARGATVTLVAGPLKVVPPARVRHVPVRTAREMYDRVIEYFPDVDVVVKAAAVADFRPALEKTGKMKKDEVGSSIELLKNPDIVKQLGETKRKDQIVVGFAAETHDARAHGTAKLREKHLDMLVLNDVSKPGAGFDYDTNIVTFLHRSGEEEDFGVLPKERVADLILDRVLRLRKQAIDT
ncbi:MAG: bifunctional phosphopantothenoylcysteine decarboxylase/phosphopantothenate--cysteine ligase CoaBC [Desulfomonile tiedjei]|nr:bifunctional phosphopantothenoylcysteine decarboxylase/phosphopantothenate--cysteine ligase CoaBC [Desulfomonile tiedjei]